ncbi:MAG: M24 family metallopeptidase [Candidatus Sungbacteria bacterium]|nr:M24 family metallopeptidase [Candidatus Sungbacteria bacterium]
MPITIKTKEEIALLREGGRRLAAVLRQVTDAARPGISTKALDDIAEDLILRSGGTPAFKGYRVHGTDVAYPATICTSVNDEVVHAIPRLDVILKQGDIVGIDIGMWYPGKREDGSRKSEMRSQKQILQHPASGIQPSMVTDMAVTVPVGAVSQEAEHLMRATKDALGIAIASVCPGIHIGDIGYAVSQRLKQDHLGIIRDLAGHGVGYALHEEPFIPNLGKPGTGPELKTGMVLAIEPMATLGDWRVVLQDDEWTFRTLDGSLAAHFEHTIVVTKDGVGVLTALDN